MPRPTDPPERVRLRVRDLFDKERQKPRAYQRRTQSELAGKIDIEPGTLSSALNGREQHAIRLAHLDIIADYFGIPPAALVAREGSQLEELPPVEQRLLAHWRELPKEIQARVMDMFDFFAGLLPEEQEARRWWYKIARLKKPSDRAELEDELNELLRRQRLVRNDADAPVARASSAATASTIHTRHDRRARK